MKRVLLAGAALFTLTACQNMDALAPWIEQGNQAAKAAGYDTDSRLAGAIKETLSISSDPAGAECYLCTFSGPPEGVAFESQGARV